MAGRRRRSAKSSTAICNRGAVIWNRTRRRNAWGKVDQAVRPEADWIRVAAPKLRLVSDGAWEAAHSRLHRSRDAYLRATGGRLWGQPCNGVAGSIC